MSDRVEPGRTAYDAYCAAAGGRSAISGELLPTWDGLREHVRQAWRAVANAVSHQFLTELNELRMRMADMVDGAEDV